eukprot:gene20089-22059_t
MDVSSFVYAAHSAIKTHFGLFFSSRDAGLEHKTIDLLSLAMFILGAFFAIVLTFMKACYGRYAQSSFPLFNWKINAKLAWFSQEVPAFGIPVAFLLIDNQNPLSLTKLALVGLFILHYWQRSFLYSLLIKGGKPTPVPIWFLAFAFCTVNGYVQVRSIHLEHFPANWLLNPVVVLGVIIFFIGLAINLHSDHVLRNLRKPGEVGYKIPRGGFFEYISAANYFGESLEWFGFFLATQTLAACAFSFFTVCNLWPRALSHHRWYKEKFEDYPHERKAILPFIL